MKCKKIFLLNVLFLVCSLHGSDSAKILSFKDKLKNLIQKKLKNIGILKKFEHDQKTLEIIHDIIYDCRSQNLTLYHEILTVFFKKIKTVKDIQYLTTHKKDLHESYSELLISKKEEKKQRRAEKRAKDRETIEALDIAINQVRKLDLPELFREPIITLDYEWTAESKNS